MNKETPPFELVLQSRDLEGNPTGKTKSFTAETPEELDRHFQRNKFTPPKNKKKNKNKPQKR